MLNNLITPLTMSKSLRLVRLAPGEFYIGMEPAMVETLLGSCIAISLYSIRKKVGMINHCMLPAYNRLNQNLNQVRGRYVDTSLQLMIDTFGTMGCKPRSLVAKLVGGSQMFTDRVDHFAVGKRNIDTAKEILLGNDIRLLAEKVGGSQGYKLIYNTSTNELLVKRLSGREESVLIDKDKNRQ